MKKVLVFGGSNSKSSINKQLAVYASSLLTNIEIQVLDLKDFTLPVFGVDLEKEEGIPALAYQFNTLLNDVDGYIISLAEHNGSYTVAFKNLLDWTSRINGKVWNDKPMLLMSTSPGIRGGKSVLEAATSRFPFMGSNIITSFSLPLFNKNFIQGQLINNELKQELSKAVKHFEEVLNQ
jgi:NAD(P)H-dependent FMN reductase